jgi:polar amino acid transport system substrate-binding protein
MGNVPADPHRRARLRVVPAAAAVIAVVLAVAGCSSSKQPSKAADTGSAAGSSAAAAGGSKILANVQKTKVLRVGTITGNAPFESLNKSGDLEGFDIDMINAVASKMGAKVSFVKTDVAGRVTVLQTGKADVVVGSFTDTPEREKVISFTDPINYEYVALIAKAGSSLNAVADVNVAGKTVAGASGGTQADTVPKVLPNAKLVLLPGIADDVQAVLSGQADAAAVANTQIGTLIKDSNGKLKALTGSVSENQKDCVGVPKGDEAWLNYVNNIVKQLNTDGTTYTLTKKWFGSEPPDFAKPPKS